MLLDSKMQAPDLFMSKIACFKSDVVVLWTGELWRCVHPSRTGLPQVGEGVGTARHSRRVLGPRHRGRRADAARAQLLV